MYVDYKSSFNILGLADWQIWYCHLLRRMVYSQENITDDILEDRDFARLEKKTSKYRPFYHDVGILIN